MLKGEYEMAIQSASAQVKGVLAIDIDETIAAPGEWNEDLIALLIETKRQNPNVDIVLFSSYQPSNFREQLNKNLTRSQVVAMLAQKELKVDKVLLTESNQYESGRIEPNIKFGDFFENIISKIEKDLLSIKDLTMRDSIFTQVAVEMGKNIDAQLASRRPSVGDVDSERKFKDYVSAQMSQLMKINASSFKSKEPIPGDFNELVRKYRNGFKMMGLSDETAADLAKNFVIAQLAMKLNAYSKQYILDPDDKNGKVRSRKPGEAFSGSEAKEMMMRHLKDQGYSHVFLVDDSADVGNLFKLQNHDKKSNVATGIREDDNLLENVSGFRFVGLKNLNLYKKQIQSMDAELGALRQEMMKSPENAPALQDKITKLTASREEVNAAIHLNTDGMRDAMTGFTQQLTGPQQQNKIKAPPPPVDRTTKPSSPPKQNSLPPVPISTASNSPKPQRPPVPPRKPPIVAQFNKGNAVNDEYQKIAQKAVKFNRDEIFTAETVDYIKAIESFKQVCTDYLNRIDKLQAAPNKGELSKYEISYLEKTKTSLTELLKKIENNGTVEVALINKHSHKREDNHPEFANLHSERQAFLGQTERLHREADKTNNSRVLNSVTTDLITGCEKKLDNQTKSSPRKL